MMQNIFAVQGNHTFKFIVSTKYFQSITVIQNTNHFSYTFNAASPLCYFRTNALLLLITKKAAVGSL